MTDHTIHHDPLARFRILTMAEVCKLTKYTRTHIYRKEAAGTFPRRVKIGPGRIGFWAHEVEAWMEARPYAPICSSYEANPQITDAHAQP